MMEKEKNDSNTYEYEVAPQLIPKYTPKILPSKQIKKGKGKLAKFLVPLITN